MQPIAPYFRRPVHHLPQRVPHARASFPPGSLAPLQVAQAYSLRKFGSGRGVKLGIVSLGGAVSMADVTGACQAWGIPVPTVNVVTTDGSTPVADPGGADTENMLDVLLTAATWYYCTGTAAQIEVAIAPNSGTGIADSTNRLVADGCETISISWGAPEQQWATSDRTVTEQAFAAALAKGVSVFAASGDNSEDDGTNTPTCDYPCGSARVWAIGGTALTLNPDGTIASEKAWGDGLPGDEGGGGGYDLVTARPGWQQGVVPSGNNGKGCPDSSANADPNTGWQILDGGAWGVVGGTSASCPFTAAYVAACKSQVPAGTISVLGPTLYGAQATAWHDITTGSNGAPSTVGWDPATGLGSPNGPGLAQALLGGGSQPPSPPATATVPSLIAMTWLAAKQALAGVNLTIAPVQTSTPSALVVAQSPGAGAVLPVGSTVTVTLGTVPNPQPDPVVAREEKFIAIVMGAVPPQWRAVVGALLIRYVNRQSNLTAAQKAELVAYIQSLE